MNYRLHLLVVYMVDSCHRNRPITMTRINHIYHQQMEAIVHRIVEAVTIQEGELVVTRLEVQVLTLSSILPPLIFYLYNRWVDRLQPVLTQQIRMDSYFIENPAHRY